MTEQLLETTTRNRRCLICAMPVSAAHLGMDSCRACASFFKRTKLSGKKFACRAGTHRCSTLKEDKWTCRRCRFDRCVAVGMVYDGPLRVNKRVVEGNENLSIINLDTSTPSTSNAPESILLRIGREYNASVDRRQAQEEVILERCADLRLVPHPKQKLYLASYKTCVSTYNVCVAETIVFFREAFPSLADLSHHEQEVLFKGYIGKFSMIETHYRTRKVWGELKRYCMNSVLICSDLDDLDDVWLGEEEGGGDRTSLLESMRSYTNSQFALVLPAFNKAQVTNKEFYALLALVLCEIDSSSDVSDSILSTLDDIRQEVFEDLQRYYKQEMGLSDFSTRLGNLMTLNHSIRECNSLFQEYFRMLATVFDLYRSEELIRELYL